MSMQHRAFLFDFCAFEKTLKAALEQALQSGSTDGLVRFIEEKKAALKDPNEGEPLPKNWREFVDIDDAHQLGDIALTMFYEPNEDCGLGSDWETDADCLEPLSTDLGFSPVLGRVVGPATNPFDPGKLGAYFLSNDDIARASDAIGRTFVAHCQAWASVVEKARLAGRGLYVTF